MRYDYRERENTLGIALTFGSSTKLPGTSNENGLSIYTYCKISFEILAPYGYFVHIDEFKL